MQERTEQQRKICSQGSGNSKKVRIIIKIIIILIPTVRCAYIVPFPEKSSSSFSSCQITWRPNSKLISWCKNFFDASWKDESLLRFLIFTYCYFIMLHCIVPLVYLYFFNIIQWGHWRQGPSLTFILKYKVYFYILMWFLIPNEVYDNYIINT